VASSEEGEITYYVKIVDEVSSAKDGKAEDSRNAAEIALAENYSQKIQDELNITAENIILQISKPFIQLTMKANGKADLYFHAYFWEKYLRSLSDLQSKGGKSPNSASESAAGQKKKKGAKADEGEKGSPIAADQTAPAGGAL